MDDQGFTYMMNIGSLISLEEQSTKQPQWTLLPQCPGGEGPSLTSFHGQCLAVSYNGVFQLHEGQWVRIQGMSVPMCYCTACVVCDQVVVVGGRTPNFFSTCTDAVRVGIVV